MKCPSTRPSKPEGRRACRAMNSGRLILILSRWLAPALRLANPLSARQYRTERSDSKPNGLYIDACYRTVRDNHSGSDQQIRNQKAKERIVREYAHRDLSQSSGFF